MAFWLGILNEPDEMHSFCRPPFDGTSVILLVPYQVSERKLYCSLLAISRTHWGRFLQGFKYDKGETCKDFIVQRENLVHNEEKRASELTVNVDPAIERGV